MPEPLELWRTAIDQVEHALELYARAKNLLRQGRRGAWLDLLVLINGQLKQADIRLAPIQRGESAFQLTPMNLKALVWFQLAQDVSTGELRRCPFCRKDFVDPKAGGRRDAEYCSRVCNVRNSQKFKRRAIELRKLRKSNPERAKILQAEGWHPSGDPVKRLKNLGW